MTKARKIVFTVITIFVVPLLMLGLLESGLRVFDVGTSYDYFHEIEISGQPHYQENPDFADQFYPSSLNIGPLENTFTRDRASNLTRVYVLGGSAAMGFPHKNHGLDRLLAAQLRAALPSRRIEVINTAMTSVNSHVVYDVAQSIPDGSADFAVILMGNNEVVGPYGPGTFNQNFLSSISLIRTIQAIKRTRIWQVLDSIVSRTRATDARQELEWEGMQMFTNNGVSYDDPRMESVYRHYESNLVGIISELRGKGMHVILSTVPVNLRHSAPFLSIHGQNMSDEQLAAWNELDTRASKGFNQSRWADAVGGFRAALEIDPDYADTHFRLATALENLGSLQEAEFHFERALDLDGLRFRADSLLNQIIRDVAAREEGKGFSFVDSVASFERASQPYQPGWKLLLEHVHFDFSGNHVLAAEISRAISEVSAAPDDYQPLPADEVARRVGFPNHETIEVIRNMQGMVQHPPFPGQSNYLELQRFLDDRLEEVTREVGSPAEVVQRRRGITRADHADWKVYFELAVLSRLLRNTQAEHYHLRKIFELYPHNHESYMKIAEVLSAKGEWREVISFLTRSLDYTRDDEEKIAETIGWLGTAYFKVGEYDTATNLLLTVPQKYPDQIDLTLKAYGNLIKYSREHGKDKDLDRYIGSVQRYARSLLRQGRDSDYPMLYARMAQLMYMGGRQAEASEWAELQKNK